MELFLLSVIQYPHHQVKHILSVCVRSVVSECDGECKEVSVWVGRVRSEVRKRIK